MVVRPSDSDQLTLREEFQVAVQAGELDAYLRRRWENASEYAGWLSEEQLPELSLEMAVTLLRAAGGSRGTEFKSNPIEEIRDSLDFLLYDTIKLEGRFDECVSDQGAYKLAGAGKEFVTYLLCLRDRRLFGVWNTHAERLMKKLSFYPDSLRKGHWGLRYIDFLESLQRLCFQMGLVDFCEADQFAYWMSKKR